MESHDVEFRHHMHSDLLRHDPLDPVTVVDRGTPGGNGDPDSGLGP